MTPVFAAKRRAEEFNSLVEGTSTSSPQDARTTDFLELVSALRESDRVEPRSEFVNELRIRLMASAERALSAAPTQSVNDRLTVAPRRTARERRIAVALGGFAIVGATTSMAMAAQSALPGDTLYPLKRAIENVHTGFSVDDNQKGSTLLANATGRLDEVEEMSRGASSDSGDAAAISETLNTFTDQASEASTLLMSDYESTGHEGSITELRDFTAASMATLSDLQSVVPDEARVALINAVQTLTQIDTLAQAACPTCAGDGIREIPPFAVNTAVEDLLTSLASSNTPVSNQGPGNQGQGNQGQGNQGPGILGGAHPPTTPVIPPSSTGGSGQPGTSPDSDPVTTITDALTGGGPSQPTSDSPVLPDLGEVLGGADDVVTDVTNPLLP